MKPVPPAFSRRAPQRWHETWHTEVGQALYIVFAYHRLACQQAADRVDDPLPMLFTDQQLTDAFDRRRQVLRLYEVLLAKPGSHADDLVVAAEHTWLYVHRLYERVPTTHRVPPPSTR